MRCRRHGYFLAYFVVAVWLIGSPVLADCRLQRVATIPLLRESGLRPLIAASINGEPVRMMLDTGAQTSSVTPETAAALALPRDADRRRVVQFMGARAMVQDARVRTLSIGPLHYSNRTVAVVALDGSRTAKTLAGIVGADILARFDLELDIHRRRLTLYRPPGCALVKPPWRGRYRTLPAWVTDYRQFLFPVELNGHPLTALFDTGSRGETVSRIAARRIRVGDAELARDPATTGTSAGLHKYAIRQHRFASLKIGAEVFRDTPLDVVEFYQPGVDIVVGADYMHRRRFFLSYSAGLLFVQRLGDETSRK